MHLPIFWLHESMNCTNCGSRRMLHSNTREASGRDYPVCIGPSINLSHPGRICPKHFFWRNQKMLNYIFTNTWGHQTAAILWPGKYPTTKETGPKRMHPANICPPANDREKNHWLWTILPLMIRTLSWTLITSQNWILSCARPMQDVKNLLWCIVVYPKANRRVLTDLGISCYFLVPALPPKKQRYETINGSFSKPENAGKGMITNHAPQKTSCPWLWEQSALTVFIHKGSHLDFLILWHRNSSKIILRTLVWMLQDSHVWRPAFILRQLIQRCNQTRTDIYM